MTGRPCSSAATRSGSGRAAARGVETPTTCSPAFRSASSVSLPKPAWPKRAMRIVCFSPHSVRPERVEGEYRRELSRGYALRQAGPIRGAHRPLRHQLIVDVRAHVVVTRRRHVERNLLIEAVDHGPVRLDAH